MGKKNNEKRKVAKEKEKRQNNKEKECKERGPTG